MRFLVEANHMNPLEHVTFTFQIENVSRAFLAQITRHRIASYTTSSQHYQDYRDYPLVMSEEMANNLDVDKVLHDVMALYERLVDVYKVPPEEARQILPNAMTVNIIWTINARSLHNFLNLRMCNRNVQEMRMFANRVHDIIYASWPEFSKLCGPDCVLPMGQCRQGKMQCKDEIYEYI